MLASAAKSVFNVANIPVHVPTTTNINNAKNGPMAKAGPVLIDVYREYRKYRNNGGSVEGFQSRNDDLVVDDGRIAVSVRGRIGIEGITNTLRELNAEIIYRSNAFKVVEAWIPIGQLHSLAHNGFVASVNPLFRPETHQMGNAQNQGDPVQRSDEVRSVYGLDGSGVKVGVISDSVNLVGNGISGSVATGNLPESGVQVISDSPSFVGGIDEGRAMLEQIHDIAPAAQLAFADAGFGSPLFFANQIRRLAEGGSDVIVDDIGLPLEPYFQPSVVDVAIQDVVGNGAVYLSSAGNSEDSGYEAPTNFVERNGTTFVDFDPSPGVDTRMRIEATGGTVFFQWDNPYNGVVGAATTDLDIYFFDPNFRNRVIAVGNANNLATGVPLEVAALRGGRFDVEIRVARTTTGKPLPTRFRFAGDFGMDSTEYFGIRSTGRGHNTGVNTISVGAVSFSSAPPFTGTGTVIVNEDFSTFGITHYVFDASGNRLPEVQVLQKPDISGADNVNTSFFGTDDPFDDDVLPNFSGTSSAAPNVAAVVALIREAAPDASQEEIANALRSTAIPLNGSAAGEFDEQGGFGLIDARAAVEQFINRPTVEISGIPTNPIDTGVSRVKFTFTHQVNGLTIEDLTLRRNNGPNLLTGGNALTTSDGGRTWALRGLANITSTPGTYVLTIDDQGPPIVNAAGQPLANSDSITFTVIGEQTRPTRPSALRVKVLNDSSVRLNWADNSDNENAFEIWRSDDQHFITGIKKFRVDGDVTTFRDEDIEPAGRPLFYRVRAVNSFAGFSSFSNIDGTVTLSPGEIVLDNESTSRVRISGNWATSTIGSGMFGSSFLTDENSGKGSKSVRYTPNIEFDGEYFVYARWTRASNRATNVPIQINSAGGSDTVTVNQRDTGGSGWVLLGKYSFRQGTSGFVTISNAGTNGVVIADSIRFLSSEGGQPIPPTE
jgi:hypothetical protein